MSRRFLPSLALMFALATLASSCAELAWWLGGGAAAVAVVPNSRLDVMYTRPRKPYHGAGLVDLDYRKDRTPLIGWVEFDDFGWYRDRDQGRVLLRELQEMSAHENVAVVLYAHGWRHNTRDGDSDTRSFQRTLRFLNTTLNSDTFRIARGLITGSQDVKVVGIAVGWRGKVWPETGTALTTPIFSPPFMAHAWNPLRYPFYPLFALDAPVYFSAFGRKQVAEVVGGTDLQSFVCALADLHGARWRRLTASPHREKMMSLVMVGHSFGGHALFDAVRDRIEGNLASAIVGRQIDGPTGIDERFLPRAPRLDAVAALPKPVTCDTVVASIGDLVVLVNPAIEAAAYKNVDALVHSATFPANQQPVLLTISSENDGARNTIFKWLRTISETGRPSIHSTQSRMEVRALGAFKEQRTNRLDLQDRSGPKKEHAKEKVRGDTLVITHAATDTSQLRHALANLRGEDLSGRFVFSNVELKPLAAAVAHSPALVVDTSSEVVNGHSDFFRQDFLDWLSRYVLEIQLQRLMQLEKVKQFVSPPGSRPFAADTTQGEPGDR